MSFPKVLSIFSLIVFGAILVSWALKHPKEGSELSVLNDESPIEIIINIPQETEDPVKSEIASSSSIFEDDFFAEEKVQERRAHLLPELNRIEEFFNTGEPKLPIVQTIRYSSRVPWKKDKAAWLADYAGHYKTSRHFIARSLNGKPDYVKQDLQEGDLFNVLNPDKNFEFYLLIDISRRKMWFYYLDHDLNEPSLIKTYDVGLGRLDFTKPSGLLTPMGRYTLGSRIAVYKPNTMGYFQGKKQEMIQIFGTRWIPFDQELEGATAPSKGFGIHGIPWIRDENGVLVEDINSVDSFDSDGCIRLATEDMEELFAIIITKPTVIELVRDFKDATFRGREETSPR